MSDSREYLKPMLMNLINGDQEAADQAIHTYIVAKTQEVAGLNQAEVVDTVEAIDDVDTTSAE